MTLRHSIPLGLALTFPIAIERSAAAEAPLELKKGDHVATVGSGLADRQQHHAYPELDLTVRNFGFGADEVNVHPRSDDVPPIEFFLSMKKGDHQSQGPSLDRRLAELPGNLADHEELRQAPRPRSRSEDRHGRENHLSPPPPLRFIKNYSL